MAAPEQRSASLRDKLLPRARSRSRPRTPAAPSDLPSAPDKHPLPDTQGLMDRFRRGAGKKGSDRMNLDSASPSQARALTALPHLPLSKPIHFGTAAVQPATMPVPAPPEKSYSPRLTDSRGSEGYSSSRRKKADSAGQHAHTPTRDMIDAFPTPSSQSTASPAPSHLERSASDGMLWTSLPPSTAERKASDATSTLSLFPYSFERRPSDGLPPVSPSTPASPSTPVLERRPSDGAPISPLAQDAEQKPGDGMPSTIPSTPMQGTEPRSGIALISVSHNAQITQRLDKKLPPPPSPGLPPERALPPTPPATPTGMRDATLERLLSEFKEMKDLLAQTVAELRRQNAVFDWSPPTPKRVASSITLTPESYASTLPEANFF